MAIHFRLPLFVACVALTAGLTVLFADEPSAPAPAATAPAAAEWKLPLEDDANLISSFASLDGRWVLCSGIVRVAGKTAFVSHLLDTRSGKSAKLTDYLDAEMQNDPIFYLDSANFSPDSKYLAVTAVMTGPPQKRRIYLVDLDAKKTRTVMESENLIFSAWCGDKLYYSSISNKLSPVSILDPTQAKPVELKKYCMILSGDPNGKFLIVGCNPDNLADELPIENKARACIAAISPDGNVIRKFDQADDAFSIPIVSPDGRYVGYAFKPQTASAPADKLVLVYSISGQDKIELKSSGKPMAVTNESNVVILDMARKTSGELDEPGMSKLIKIVDAKGQIKVLAQDVNTAAVGGDRLFVTSPDAPNVLKAIPLPKK